MNIPNDYAPFYWNNCVMQMSNIVIHVHVHRCMSHIHAEFLLNHYVNDVFIFSDSGIISVLMHTSAPL